jgi:hypothetical protein
MVLAVLMLSMIVTILIIDVNVGGSAYDDCGGGDDDDSDDCNDAITSE